MLMRRRQSPWWMLLLLVLASSAGTRAMADWPDPPGVVIARSAAPRTDFLGSPSIAILPDGRYVASHDVFGRDARRLHWSDVYVSEDRGASWVRVAELRGQFWSTLFVHRGALYLLGTRGEYQDIVIRRSDDGGRTWTEPRNAQSGRLVRGSFHCGSMPVVEHGGRLWRAFEEYTGPDGRWSGRHFRAFVMSAPVDGDLLSATTWQRTNGLHFDGRWVPGERTGWLEGNVVVDPAGNLVNILRLQANASPDHPFALPGPARAIPRYEVGALMQIDPAQHRLSFDPESGLIHFPGSQSRFTIRPDPRGGRYWSLVQKITAPHEDLGGPLPNVQRNVLRLTTSTDLRTWKERTTVLRWREGERLSGRAKVGFQYVDWQFDGDDIVAVSRTAWNADNYHNSNLITFHRIRSFRELTMADSAAPLITP